LFDAVASIAGLRQVVRFEGQAAMELEFALSKGESSHAYSFALRKEQIPHRGNQNKNAGISDLILIDWEEVIRSLLKDVLRQATVAEISCKFHNALVGVITEVAQKAGIERVVLTGGCFQNRYLTERAVMALEAAGFRPYWHQRVPPNDGGIALGQIYARILTEKEEPGSE
jgi:hydrogenase maturation protein HypF